MFKEKIRDALNGVLKPVNLRLIRGWDRPRNDYIFHHSCPDGPPSIEFDFPKIGVEASDLDLSRRVVEAYNAAEAQERALRQDDIPKDDLWDKIAQSSHCDFVTRLRASDVEGVAGQLVNALRHPMSYGLSWDHGALSYELARDDEKSGLLGRMIVDRLLALAEALGVVRVEFPEWGQWGKSIYSDLGEVCDRIDEALGFPISIPPCFGLYGVRAGRHRVHVMAAAHAYTAWRIENLLETKEASHICEIGGGYGGVAHYSFQKPPTSYSLIDLPLVNALQGYFLMKTCGAENVRLYGEDHPDRPIAVLPYWCMKDMADNCFDLVISQESLPEIDRENAEAYIEDIARTSKRYFLSINQETGATVSQGSGFRHNVVADLVRAQGGFERIYRFPYWIRRGQLEELFVVR